MPYSSAPSLKARNSRSAVATTAAGRARRRMFGKGGWRQVHPRTFRGRTQCRARTGQRSDVEDQGDAAVAGDGGARHVADAAEVGFEVLHDDLLLAEQFVDEQRDARRPSASTTTT